MPENSSDPSASDSADYQPTAAELDRARAELATYSPEGRYFYACGSLRYIAEELVAGRANEHTIAAARHALAMAAIAKEIPSDQPDAV
ncbi:hypothetical protein I6A60_13680 [Frankia sp. AgB1.9]|uniref:hypothetical protein n=1 Tax=unclassified Frankia TaxID=2632575 RepID=UPI00193155FD|nr:MULTISPECIES: hypothetical protein [unclassified Frankia]MBL7487612.1 hypothetical protein [Frankia sp. AgW1.1]MBL7548922.1 hypothetical protein [Frankia sp. AgB1.9]MBL7624890.1 hypothetical protein [Frankia sp. AgB1.8]